MGRLSGASGAPDFGEVSSCHMSNFEEKKHCRPVDFKNAHV